MTGRDPLVTVVVPTYERWPMVAEAVDSALEQDLTDIEVIVVDDGSTDGTAEHLAGRDPRLQIIRQANRGRSAARNAGIATARGTWIAFLDSDDRFEPWHLSQAVGDDATTATTSGLTYWNPDDDRRWAPSPATWLPADLREASLIGMAVSLPTLVVPRWAVQRVGGFSEALRGSEDWVFLVHLSRVVPIRRVERPSVLVRVHEGRSMTDVDWDLEWRRRATTALLDDATLATDDRERSLISAGTHRYAAARLYEVGRMREARSELRAVWRSVPPATAASWTARLGAQTLLGGTATASLRRARVKREGRGPTDERLRVLYVVHTASHNRILNSLLDALSDRMNVTVAALVAEGSMQPDLDARGIELLQLPPGRMRAVGRLRAEIGSGRFDLVQPNGYLAGLHTELARTSLRRPIPSLLGRHHNLEHHLGARPIHRVLDGWCARHATRVLAVSAAVMETLTQREGVSPADVIVVPNGSHWERLTTDPTEVARWRTRFAGKEVAVAVGRIDPIKDLPTVVGALAIARSDRPDLVLAIAGVGTPERERELDEVVRSHAVEGAVTRLGWVPDIQNLIAAADVFVQASVDESFGESVLEAIGAGVPVAVTTVGGVRDIVGDWYPPIEAGDPSALATAIIERLDHPDPQRCAAAAADVRRRFSDSLMSEAYLAASLETVGARRG